MPAPVIRAPKLGKRRRTITADFRRSKVAPLPLALAVHPQHAEREPAHPGCHHRPFTPHKGLAQHWLTKWPRVPDVLQLLEEAPGDKRWRLSDGRTTVDTAHQAGALAATIYLPKVTGRRYTVVDLREAEPTTCEAPEPVTTARRHILPDGRGTEDYAEYLKEWRALRPTLFPPERKKARKKKK